jgi:flavin reductase (DIM6/NTAB) family NADH-FMN oxidoreductase RutF
LTQNVELYPASRTFRYKFEPMPLPTYASFQPADLPLAKLHGLLLGVVAPRPIALASTINSDGQPNLAPFSYFNVFSTHPPLVIFSPNRSGRTGQQKDTLLNVLEVPEVVINLVSYSIVEQVNIASSDYPRGVDEFQKAGLTPIPSTHVRPARVAESPAQLECTIREVISLGEAAGSGNLILCEVVALHIQAQLLNENGIPDPQKLDLVARMGANWYCRAQGEAIMEVEKPIGKQCIGVDGLPESVRLSNVFTGNDLGRLANTDKLPDAAEIEAFALTDAFRRLTFQNRDELHRLVQVTWASSPLVERWLLLLAGERRLTQ